MLTTTSWRIHKASTKSLHGRSNCTQQSVHDSCDGNDAAAGAAADCMSSLLLLLVVMLKNDCMWFVCTSDG